MKLLVAANIIFGQTAPTDPSFEVASVKQVDGNYSTAEFEARKIGMRILGDRVEVRSTLLRLIALAYEVEVYQVVGPPWLSSVRFEIMAKMPASVNREQAPAMLRKLLAERFKLAQHRQAKETPVYALLAGKEGTQFKQSLTSEDNFRVMGSEQGTSAGYYADDKRVTVTGSRDNGEVTISGSGIGEMHITIRDGIQHLMAPKITMALLAKGLSSFVDRPVIDIRVGV